MSAPTASTRAPLLTVGALIVAPTGRVLLVRTHKWRGSWGVPGGKVRYGERLLAALAREVREETGLELGEVRWGPVQEAVESPEFERPEHFLLLNFVARTDEEREVRLNDEAEAWRWATPAEALGLELNSFTRVLVRHYLEHGLAGETLT